MMVALPSIQHTLHASASTLQWTVAGYTLAFALLPITAAGWATGTAADRLPHRPGRVHAGVGADRHAQSIALLIAARVLQGRWRR